MAGERIAQILGGKSVRMQTRGFAKYYSFSRNNEEYAVIPLRGHIVEVDFPKQYSYWRGTDLKQLVNAPILYLPSDPPIANLLREMGKQAKEVIIATDADREGESIGVEALRILQETNPIVPVARAYFSAMTPKELVKSFDELVKVDFNLSDSADSRREIDLVWGAALTRFVSIMSNRMGKEFISVGRVQTPVLRLIVDKEKERLAFVIQPYWEIIAHCEKETQKFEAFHKGGKIFDEAKAKSIFEKVKDAKKGKVVKVVTRKKSIPRPIPFNTTQLLRSASALGMTAGQAMNIAESLYMSGYISYPRTDNTVYPDTLDLRELLNELGTFSEYRKFVDQILSKPLNPSRGDKNTTDHPPVHPTKVPAQSKIGEKEWRLFDLVARRFLATFLPDAQTENVSVELDIHTEPFIATGQTILSPGWKSAYPFSTLQEIALPKLKEGEMVDVKKMDMPRKETQPPARYSQSALLKIMEELNLGTKSTRHSILEKLFARKYITGIKSIEPNQIAFAVIDSLEKHCRIVTEPKMTAELEHEMDGVANGNKTKVLVVEDSRKMLHGVLDQLLENKSAISFELKKALVHKDVLAVCPKDGGNLIIRKAGATGKRFLGCSNYPHCKTTYSLPQKGTLSPAHKNCPTCNTPMVRLVGSRFKMEICLNYDCASKDAWKKTQAEKAAAASAAFSGSSTPHPHSSSHSPPIPSVASGPPPHHPPISPKPTKRKLPVRKAKPL